jgi:aminoglycoside 6'-N-acetyltransferase
VSLPTLIGARVSLRPLGEADLDRLATVVAAPGVAEWWSPPRDQAVVREDLRNDGAAFAVDAAGALAGWLGFEEETDPDHRQAAFDVFLDPPHQGRGLGPDALRLAIRWLIGRGHHRFTIDPALANSRAIAAYRSVGFRPVGVMRRYERGRDGRFHDSLLMDLLAEELVE